MLTSKNIFLLVDVLRPFFTCTTVLPGLLCVSENAYETILLLSSLDCIIVRASICSFPTSSCSLLLLQGDYHTETAAILRKNLISLHYHAV